MIVFEMLFLITCVTFLWFLWQRRQFYLLHFKLPGRFGYPLLGVANEVFALEDVLPTLERYFEKYGPVVYTWLGPMPVLALSDPQTIKDVLSEDTLKKGSIYYPFDESLGRGLFSMDDPEYTPHRRLLNVAFQPKILNGLFPIFNEETTDFIHTLDGLVGKGETNLEYILYAFTMNSASRTTLGTSLNSQTPEWKTKMIRECQYLIERMADLFTKPWLRIKPLRLFYRQFDNHEKCKKFIHDFMGKVVTDKLKEKADGWEPKSIVEKSITVNVAVENFKNGIFSSKNLQDHCLNIVGGAVETSGSVILNILALLAMFPEYDERLFEEIKSILPDKDCEVTPSDVQNMTYMDIIINESMRVLPTIPAVIREVVKEIKLSNGVTLPKGLRIVISLFSLHRSKKVWGPDAHTFNPDHFLPVNMEQKHPYSYIPFMKGRRNCIGWRYALLSMKLTLARVLRNYRFTTTFKFEDLAFVEDIKLKLKETPLLEVHRRTV